MHSAVQAQLKNLWRCNELMTSNNKSWIYKIWFFFHEKEWVHFCGFFYEKKKPSHALAFYFLFWFSHKNMFWADKTSKFCGKNQNLLFDLMRLFRVMDFVEENAPTTAAAGASAAAGGIAMSPSLPMTASSGTPPGIYNFFCLSDLHRLECMT